MGAGDKNTLRHKRAGPHLSIIDLRLSTETQVLELNALPQDMLYDGARHVLLLTLQDLGQIASIDHSNKIIGRYKVVASEPTGLAWTRSAAGSMWPCDMRCSR